MLIVRRENMRIKFNKDNTLEPENIAIYTNPILEVSWQEMETKLLKSN